MADQVLPAAEGKLRIVQELVPGRQVTLAHIIASPDPDICQSLKLAKAEDSRPDAIGILSMSPAEITVIAGDLAAKNSGVKMGRLDLVGGTLLFTGPVADVESAMQAILDYLQSTLDFAVCALTKT